MGKKLPIGIQSFEKLRTDGFLYVDKTSYIYELVQCTGDGSLCSLQNTENRPLCLPVLRGSFYSLFCARLCSCSNTCFNWSGTGRPRWAAFSRILRPLLAIAQKMTAVRRTPGWFRTCTSSTWAMPTKRVESTEWNWGMRGVVLTKAYHTKLR